MLAREAVGARLVAGVQLSGPVTSVFWHLGEFGESQEWKVTFKTTMDRYADLERHLLENHPWKNPEIAVTPIITGSADYLQWILNTTARSEEP